MTKPLKSKNSKLLARFIAYCLEHPNERFWQALRNWSGVNYLLKSSHYEAEMFNQRYLLKNNVKTEDTFYL